jgi:hypothetical protein|nr:MAG TPA: hypothetical protein [Caudoviricetes sp.]
MSEKIIAYKAMDKNMQCRGKQYEVGKTYHEDKADCCNAGMHACENPLDVLHYYPLKDSPRFFEVECGGNVDKSVEDSKLACTELTVKGEVNFAGLVKAEVNAVFNRVKGKEHFSSGNYSTAGSSGNYSTAGSSGYSSTAGSSGYYSTAGSSGYSSTAGSSGYYSTAGSSGNYSTAGSSGNYSTAGSSGDSSTAGSSGYSSTAGSSGDSSTAGSSGYSSTAGSSGNYSTAGSSGNYSTAAATGAYCRAKADGKDNVAVANGAHSKARGILGCYLVLTEYDDDGNMLWAKMAKVDGAHIKENVWYTLENGEFAEAEP